MIKFGRTSYLSGVFRRFLSYLPLRHVAAHKGKCRRFAAWGDSMFACILVKSEEVSVWLTPLCRSLALFRADLRANATMWFKRVW